MLARSSRIMRSGQKISVYMLAMAIYACKRHHVWCTQANWTFLVFGNWSSWLACATHGGGCKHGWPLLTVTFGPGGLRAPPVVADGCEAGHCFHWLFCQAHLEPMSTIIALHPTQPGKYPNIICNDLRRLELGNLISNTFGDSLGKLGFV